MNNLDNCSSLFVWNKVKNNIEFSGENNEFSDFWSNKFCNWSTVIVYSFSPVLFLYSSKYTNSSGDLGKGNKSLFISLYKDNTQFILPSVIFC